MLDAFTYVSALMRLIGFVVIVYMIAKRIQEKRVYWHLLAFLVLAVALNAGQSFGILEYHDPVAIGMASAIFVILVIGSIIENHFREFLIHIVLVASIVTIGYFLMDFAH